MDAPNMPFIVGRELFFQNLQRAFVDRQLVVVAGRSGIGKTAVLQEYVHRFSQEYQSILWFNAASDETFLADLITALESYSLSIDITQGVVRLFHTLQQYLNQKPKSLLIMENFAYTFSLQGVSDRQPGLYIIISTHAPQTPPQIPRLELMGLDAQDGATLLLHQAGFLAAEEGRKQEKSEPQQAALELSHEVHGLPITLYLINNYLRMTGEHIEEYLASFRAYPIPIYRSASSDQSAMKEFVTVCERSLTFLKETHPDAFELLQIVALHFPETIPSILFQSQAESPVGEIATELSPSSLLITAGFITVNQQSTSWTLHRLLQNIVLQTLSEEEKSHHLKQIFSRWQRLISQQQSENPSQRLQMAGQIRHLITMSESESAFSDPLRTVDEAADVCAWAANVFWGLHLVSLAEPLLRRSLSIWQSTLDNAHPMVANVLANLATMNRVLKNYQDAETFAHRAIVSKSSALGINHPDVLLILDQLGQIYAEQGKNKEAQQCYEKALTIAKQVDLRRHPIYNTLRYDLALLHITQKNWDMAEELLRQVSIDRQYTLGIDDPETINAFSHLADVCIHKKNWQMAQAVFKQLLPAQQKVLGAEHPTVLYHLEQEASVFLHLGKIAEAKEQLQRVQLVQERLLGKNDPRTLEITDQLERMTNVQV